MKRIVLTTLLAGHLLSSTMGDRGMMNVWVPEQTKSLSSPNLQTGYAYSLESLLEIPNQANQAQANNYMFENNQSQDYAALKSNNAGTYKKDIVDKTSHFKIRLSRTGDRISADSLSVLTNEQLWRRMSWQDWNQLPEGIRQQALDNVFEKYAVAMNPESWDAMNATHWDRMPDVLRVAAILKMAEYSAQKFQLGDYLGRNEDPKRELGAVMMKESSLYHRAINKQRGNEDIGVGQQSRWTRKTLAKTEQFKDLKDADFYNPWVSAKATGYWLANARKEGRNDKMLSRKIYNAGLLNSTKGMPEVEAYAKSVQSILERQFNPNKKYAGTWGYILNKAWSDGSGKNL